MGFSFNHFEQSFCVSSFQFKKIVCLFVFNIEETGNMFASVKGDWETVEHREDDVFFTPPLDLCNPLQFF